MTGTAGRALHLLDVEYLGLGPKLTPRDLELVLRHYRCQADWHVGDHLVGAASHFTYRRIAFDCDSDLRLLPAGRGPDAADLRLIDEATHVIDLTRYDRIVVASGDHIFGVVADTAHELGLEVWAAAYEFNLARSLAAAVDHVVDLTVGHALAA
jgi:hypothetical protein